MTGSNLKTLMTALEVGSTELGLEAGVSRQAIRFNLKSKKLRAATESRLISALEIVATRRRADRLREQTEHLLALVDVD